MVLKSIWEARCDLLHHNIETQPAAAASALSKFRTRISALAYTRIPSPLFATRQEEGLPPTAGAEEVLNRLTWGRVAHQLLHPRHRGGRRGDPCGGGGGPANPDPYIYIYMRQVACAPLPPREGGIQLVTPHSPLWVGVGGSFWGKGVRPGFNFWGIAQGRAWCGQLYHAMLW